MNPQIAFDGVVSGALIGLGATGVTLTYSILRFANFAHGEFITFGAYAALVASALAAALVAGAGDTIDPFSISPALILAAPLAMTLTAGFALALDYLLFSRLRGKGDAISIVMASFGASLAIRAAIEFVFTSSPAYFNHELQIAQPLGFGVKSTPNQLAMLATALALMGSVHLLLTRTQMGRAMRAVSENPGLARVAGVDVEATIRVAWALGGALAAAAGVALGLLVQIRPFMGFDLLLPLFAAAILGGIGSVPGAFLGALIIGLGEALTVDFLGAQWRAAVAFVVLVGVLLLRPSGIMGRPA